MEQTKKIMDVLIVVEGFLVLHVAHYLGVNYLAPLLSQIWPSLSPITIGSMSSSDISSAIAALYMYRRTKTRPVLAVGSHTFLAIGGGIVLVWIMKLLALIWFDPHNPEAREILSLPTVDRWLCIVLLTIWGPFWEESLTRGVIFQFLYNRYGILIAAAVSTSFFVASHALWGGLSVALLLIAADSLVYTVIYLQGGILAAALVHMFANAYILILNL